MSRKWLLGGAAVIAILVGGYALAQSHLGSGHQGMGGMYGQMHGGRMHAQSAGQRGSGQMHGRQGGMNDHDQHRNGPRRQQDNIDSGGTASFDPALLARRKAEIGIRPEQEAVWSKYEAAVQAATGARQSRRDTMDDTALQKMTPGDRFAFVSARRDEARKELETIAAAGKGLLAALDDNQKSRTHGLPALEQGGSRHSMNGGSDMSGQQRNANGAQHRH